MDRLTKIGTVLFVGGFVGLFAAEAFAASPCKGLAENTCGSTSGCRWTAALIAGETKTRKGEVSKVSRKAHCRPGTIRQS